MRLRRNRVIASPRFRELAPRIPFVATVARSRANALFDLTAGFAYSQALAAIVEAGLCETLGDRAMTSEEIAAALPVDLPKESLARLLDAATGLGLVWVRDGRYALDDLGVALANEPGVVAMVRHHALTYRDLANPLTLLTQTDRPTETRAFWRYADNASADAQSDDNAAAYSELMAVTQGFVGREVAALYPFRRHRHLVDVGGGSGAFVARVAKVAPRLHCTVFDLPDVAPLAEQRLRDEGLAERCGVVAGSFLTDAIPEGADLYSLVRVLYDHEDEPAAQILSNVHAAMPSKATLLIAEPMAMIAGHERVGAYFAMYLAAMRGGHCRTEDRLRDMLREAGFERVASLRPNQPVFTGLIVATKP